jgi:hypothetical protein
MLVKGYCKEEFLAVKEIFEDFLKLIKKLVLHFPLFKINKKL